MDIKNNVLEQIHAAQDVIINALANPNLTPFEIKALQDASSKLRKMERSIVELIGQSLVDSLTTDFADLNKLIEDIKKSAEKLEGVAAVVEKASAVVEELIGIVGTAIPKG
jgi:uncharacterized protein YoxC